MNEIEIFPHAVATTVILNLDSIICRKTQYVAPLFQVALKSNLENA